MLQAKRTIVILSLALAGCRSSIAQPTITPQIYNVRVLATTSTHVLLQDLASDYAHSGVQLVLEGVPLGWDAVYSHLQAGDVPYALTSYLPLDANLWVAPIGQDGLAIVVHPTNDIPLLSMNHLQLIFQGRAVTWDEVGGPEGLPITVISREAGADTRLIFETLVMGDRHTTLNARLVLSDSSVLDTVARIPGAIGYVSMGLLDSRVRAVPLLPADGGEAGGTGVLPSPDTVGAGLYPLVTPIVIVGLVPPDSDSIYRAWFAWMQSEEGQAVVTRRYGPLPGQ